MKLKLSDEHFCNDHEVFLNECYQYDNYITDGVRCFDNRVCVVTSSKQHNLSDFQGKVIIDSINEKLLKKVLDTKNQVEILPISYKNYSLAVGNNFKILVDTRKIESDYTYEAFFYEDKIYFFEYLEAVPDMQVEEDSYMFVYFLMIIAPQCKRNLKIIKILKEINNLAEKLESEQN